MSIVVGFFKARRRWNQPKGQKRASSLLHGPGKAGHADSEGYEVFLGVHDDLDEAWIHEAQVLLDVGIHLRLGQGEGAVELGVGFVDEVENILPVSGQQLFLDFHS